MAAETQPQAETLNLHQRLLEVQRAVTQLTKDGQHKGGGEFKYVSSSAVLSAVREVMDAQGLVLAAGVTDYTLHPNAANNGKWHLTELMMELTWINVDNPKDRETYHFPGQGIDSGEKGIGKAATYAEKYFLLKFFHIPTDGDDPDAGDSGNGNGHSRPQASRQQPPPQQQAAPPAPAQAPPQQPQRIDNPPDGAPQTVGALRTYLVDQGVEHGQHEDVVNALIRATKPEAEHMDINALTPKQCVVIWKRHRASGATSADAPEPEPPAEPASSNETQARLPGPNVNDYTQETPPAYADLKLFWDSVAGLGQARQAAIVSEAQVDLGKEIGPDECWALWVATWTMVAADETGALAWTGAEVVA